MKRNFFVIILLLVCIGLGAGWFVRHKKAVKEKEADVAKIEWLSNEVKQTSAKMEEQREVISNLQTNLSTKVEQITTISSDVTSLTANLAKVEAEAKTAAESAQAELAKRDAKITELESQRDDLTKRMTDLNGAITNLETTIAETEKKLEASEGDRDFLLAELKRLQTEKAELERQFSDLAVLREQVRKLRDELSIAKRLEWIRRGIYGSTLKGAELLQQGFAVAPVEKRSYDLEVELKQDARGQVLSPAASLPDATNTSQ
jgi:chromosome segregation ATPase